MRKLPSLHTASLECRFMTSRRPLSDVVATLCAYRDFLEIFAKKIVPSFLLGGFLKYKCHFEFAHDLSH